MPDMNVVLQTFLDETIEMLESMEKALLDIEIDNPEYEKINLMFRVMHSLKSGSAIFEFTTLSNFSHNVETLLDDIRNGKHRLNQTDVNLLFSIVDALRTTIECIRNKQPANEKTLLDLDGQVADALQDLNPQPKLSSPQPEASIPAPPIPSPINKEEKSNQGWLILIPPSSIMYELGNDPIRAFKALSFLGKNRISIKKIEELPSLKEANPLHCYLSWQIEFFDAIDQAEIRELFSWVTDADSLKITRLETSTTKESISSSIIAKSTFLKEPPKAHPSSTIAWGRKDIHLGELSSSIRVPIEKIDTLMNIVGDLVIAQSMLNQAAKSLSFEYALQLEESFERLNRSSRQLQESVMNIRMVPVSLIFNRYPRLVRDLASKVKKEIELIMVGENTELDKMVMEIVGDPILHLVRNAIDHGIELPHVRKRLGKPLPAKIELNAYQEGGKIIIDIKDDGAGLNKLKILQVAKEKGLITEGMEITDDKLYQFIFLPGFSTSENVTDISGRGVGLDIVYNNINKIDGKVIVQSIAQKGSIFSLQLPLTLAIMDCQLIRVESQTFIIPLFSIVELFKIEAENIKKIDKKITLYNLRGEYLPVIFLTEVLGFQSNPPSNVENKYAIIVDFNNKLHALICDALLDQQQVVIKSIENNYKKIKVISGATILGDGEISLILDISGIIISGLHNEMLGHMIRDKFSLLRKESKKATLTTANKNMDLISVQIGESEFGINMLEILEIQAWKSITPLPHTPSHVEGIINFRGIIVPVFDLYKKFIANSKTYSNKSSIIIMNPSNDEKRIFAILVDTIIDTITINKTKILPPPESKDSTLRDHMLGVVSVNNRAITLIDMDKIYEMECLD